MQSLRASRLPSIMAVPTELSTWRRAFQYSTHSNRQAPWSLANYQPTRVVTGLHIGPYDRLAQTYAEMSAWASAHGFKPTGDMWEVYLSDPARDLDPKKWRTGVFLCVE